jgi:hypothetical protein
MINNSSAVETIISMWAILYQRMQHIFNWTQFMVKLSAIWAVSTTPGFEVRVDEEDIIVHFTVIE